MTQRGRPGLSPEKKGEVWGRWRQGESFSEIGRAVGKSVREKERDKLIPVVRAIHKSSRGIYGSRRISEELEETTGVRCGKYKAGTLMKLACVEAIQKKKFKATTKSKHNLPVAPNLLKRQFDVNTPDTVWAGDITYVWTAEGWLSVLQPCFSGVTQTTRNNIKYEQKGRLLG